MLKVGAVKHGCQKGRKQQVSEKEVKVARSSLEVTNTMSETAQMA
jgi:hypothetical protein